MSQRLKNLHNGLWEAVCFLGKKCFSLYCRIAGHTEITESISDKQKQINKAYPAVGWEAVSQCLLEANENGESISEIPALHPNTTDREHINRKNIYGSAGAAPPKHCLEPVHIFLKSFKTFNFFYNQYYQKHFALGTSYSELASNVNLPYNSFVIWKDKILGLNIDSQMSNRFSKKIIRWKNPKQ